MGRFRHRPGQRSSSSSTGRTRSSRRWMTSANRVRRDVLRREALTLARQRAGDVATSLRDSENFSSSAEAADLTVSESELITRGAPFPEVGVSPALERIVFELPVGGVSDVVETGGDTVAVVHVVERQDVTAEELAEARGGLRKRAPRKLARTNSTARTCRGYSKTWRSISTLRPWNRPSGPSGLASARPTAHRRTASGRAALLDGTDAAVWSRPTGSERQENPANVHLT